MKATSNYILRRLVDVGATGFTASEFGRILQLRMERAYQILHSMERAGFLKRVAQGRYVVVGYGRGEILGEPFFLGSRLVEPSYVSFWSALHYYAWTEQAPRLVFVANTRRSGTRRVDAYAFRLVRLAASRFFGYEAARRASFDFPIALPEKAIVDSFFLPANAGGVRIAAEALQEAFDGLDLRRLEDFALSMGSRTLCSRLGFLLSASGASSERLRGDASRTYVKLDPSGPRRGRFDSRWKVIDNLSRGG